MNYIRTASLVFSLSLPLILNAANIPSVVNGNEQYDKKSCISNKINDCISSVCVNSSDIDCEDNCRKISEDKCQ